MTRSTVLGLLAVLVCVPEASAATITFDAVNVAGNTWRYDYSVANTSVSDSIEEFTVFFALGLYSNLSVSATPADWDSLVIQPDPALPADGFFDSLALKFGA